MQSTAIPDFDIAQFKSVMDQAPIKENGWELTYEGPILKEHPDCTMKIYKRSASAEATLTMKIEAVWKGIKPENFVDMMRDLEKRKSMGHPPKQIKLIEQTSKNSDVIYLEMDLPFPLTNRDFVQKRLYVGNKEDPELIKQLGLYEKDHKYFAVMVQSTERSEYPVKSKPIRGETKMHYTLLEEDPKEKGIVRMKMAISQKLNGDIPKMVVSKVGEKMPKKMIGSFLESYIKFYGREL